LKVAARAIAELVYLAEIMTWCFIDSVVGINHHPIANPFPEITAHSPS
jgi:hypothetical protein